MEKFLVTGGAGFIGSNLCRELLNRGKGVLCLDDLSTGKQSNIVDLLSNSNFQFVEHDLTKPFFPKGITGIFNLACPASPVHYQYNPIRTLKMGTLAIYNVLGMAAKNNITVLQASTSEIYGDPKVHPQSEDYWGHVNPIGPRACYDEGKRVAESLCVSYRDYSGVDIRIARIFNTYGPFMCPDDGRVISNIIVQSLNGHDITIYGDGSQTRSFCFIDDLVDGLIRLFYSDYQDPVNLGNDRERSILDTAEEILNLSGSQSEIKFQELPVDDPKKRRPDLSKASKILDWKPKTDFKSGISKTIDWFRKELNLN